MLLHYDNPASLPCWFQVAWAGYPTFYESGDSPGESGSRKNWGDTDLLRPLTEMKTATCPPPPNKTLPKQIKTTTTQRLEFTKLFLIITTQNKTQKARAVSSCLGPSWPTCGHQHMWAYPQVLLQGRVCLWTLHSC